MKSVKKLLYLLLLCAPMVQHGASCASITDGAATSDDDDMLDSDYTPESAATSDDDDMFESDDMLKGSQHTTKKSKLNHKKTKPTNPCPGLECTLSFKKPSDLGRHFFTQHSEEPWPAELKKPTIYTCTKGCGKTHFRKKDNIKHEESCQKTNDDDDTIQSYACLKCPNIFGKPSDLGRHFFTQHPKEPWPAELKKPTLYPCMYGCGQSSTHKAGISSHEKQCKANNPLMTLAMASDQKEKELQQELQQALLIKKQLEIVNRLKTADNPIEAFNQLRPEEKYQKNGTQQYACLLCNKKATKPSDLIEHFKVHDQNDIDRHGNPITRKYSCDFCKLYFFRIPQHKTVHESNRCLHPESPHMKKLNQ